jgi:hypothetical protein
MAWLHRKGAGDAHEADHGADEAAVEPGTAPGPDQAAPARGPWDVSEANHMFTREGPAAGVVDLGSLLVQLREGLDLRLQVDEASGAVLAALVVGEDGMLELRAFAAARNEDLWTDVRREIAADTAQRGGTATEREGAFGPELYCEVQVQLEDGSIGVQPSRIIGWNGPRWFLRGALLGRPAMEPDAAGPWEDVFAAVAVRRGDVARPPGEALPIQLPPEALRVE